MWGRAVLALLAALAALVLALLMTPVRVRMWFGGEGFRVRATVAVSPWPFLFWYGCTTGHTADRPLQHQVKAGSNASRSCCERSSRWR